MTRSTVLLGDNRDNDLIIITSMIAAMKDCFFFDAVIIATKAITIPEMTAVLLEDDEVDDDKEEVLAAEPALLQELVLQALG